MACSEGSNFMEPGETCTICLEQIHFNSSTGKGFAKLKCGHIFHLCCIGSQFNCKAMMQCPNCRTTEESDWLYSAPPVTDDDFITVDEAEDLMNSILQGVGHLLPCGCPCHGGHGHDAYGHGVYNPPADHRVSRGHNVRGNGNPNQQQNVHVHHHQNMHNYGAISVRSSGPSNHSPINLSDRPQTRPVNRRRARDPEATVRPRRRTRLMTAIYDDPSSLLNPNTSSGPILGHPVHVQEQVMLAVPMVQSVNQNTIGAYVGPILRRPVPVPEQVMMQLPVNQSVNQNTIGGYVGPILPHSVPSVRMPANANANANRVFVADERLLELSLSPPGEGDMLELRLQPPRM